MPQYIEDIQKTLADISKGNDVMDMLLELERTMDSIDIFAYAHWADGELVSGPVLDRYFITTTWMYPYKRMPDPDGLLRLKKIGCDVNFKKDTYLKPTKVISPADWTDSTTKQAKLEEHVVWLVTIRMPIKYVQDLDNTGGTWLENEIDKTVEEIANEYQVAPSDESGDDGMGDMGDMGDMGGEDFADEDLQL